MNYNFRIQNPFFKFIYLFMLYCFSFKFLFQVRLTYSVILVSSVQFRDSTLPCSTQCLSQVPSLIPITYFTHPSPTSPLVTISLFSMVKSLFLVLSLFFLFVLFLKFYKEVNSYGICLSLAYFA